MAMMVVLMGLAAAVGWGSSAMLCRYITDLTRLLEMLHAAGQPPQTPWRGRWREWRRIAWLHAGLVPSMLLLVGMVLWRFGT